ncbi:tyrosine-type recombinase/integrase [Arthrobacter cryoconiti]|uniref:Tyrosine-type recombinase/integrase n=1 Tax=Arthrobacter cryoconiti TaxID=748907 RepID=A0ABV8R0N3_9MICC|nr:tyrosine-type recombinase/integrase [Arthrobacter cryoconiti]MCC9068567.1 tyrosine-type recombinase/integrase [Arthrobacter cryoconiti]
MELEAITSSTPNQARHGQLIAAWQLAQTSPNTARAYTRSMLDFCVWLDGHGMDLLTIKRPIVDGYRHALAVDGAPATVAAKLAALSSFYRYAVSADLAQGNPVELVKRPKINPDHTETAGLTKDQARALRASAKADGERSYALVSLQLFTGVRIGEALNATTADYGHDKGHRTLKVRRKGGEADKVAVPAPAVEALNVYLETTGREMVAGKAGVGLPIFTTATGKQWAPSEAFRTIQRLARKAGIEGKISPHSLRHAFATLALDAGATLHDVQDSMGHADPRTTRRYDHARHTLEKSAGYTVARVLA